MYYVCYYLCRFVEYLYNRRNIQSQTNPDYGCKGNVVMIHFQVPVPNLSYP